MDRLPRKRRRTPSTRLLALVALLLAQLCGCASLPEDYPRRLSHAIEDTEETALGQQLAPLIESHPEESGFYPLVEGTDALVARVAAIRAAERSLDVQYYIWKNDTAGRILIQRLLEAADRGVRVRLLLDDLDTAGKDFGLGLVDAHPNIEIHLFNAFANRSSRLLGFLTDLDRVNRRMHNKSLTADNQLTIVGGRNVGNEYFGGVSAAAFSDLDMVAIGPVVNEVSAAFDSYWNSEWAIPLSALSAGDPPTRDELQQGRIALDRSVEELVKTPYGQALQTAPLVAYQELAALPYSWGRAILLYDAPSKAAGAEMSATTHIGPRLAELFEQTQRELLIVSPYFVPGPELVGRLGDLEDRGVRVRILTNSLAANDVGIVHAGYMRYRVPLLQRGVELYEFKPIPGQDDHDDTDGRWSGSSRASLHAKTFGIDRRALFVGSFNLDPRSVLLNTEMGVLFESPALAGQLGEAFDTEVQRAAYRVQLRTIPGRESQSGFDETALQWLSMEDGEEVLHDKEPETTALERVTVEIMSLFVIESFL